MRDEHLIQYTLTPDETKIFLNLILRDPHSPYTAFIIVLLKEMDYDMSKFLRVLGVMINTKGLIKKSLYNKVIATIKEAVVVKDIEFKQTLDTLTIQELSKSSRYKAMGISRPTIYDIINKHDLTYEKQIK